jgi:hypothetical protein
MRLAGASPKLDIRAYTLRYLNPELVVRDTRGWGESQAGDIRFCTLRYLSPRLLVRDTRG